MLLHFLDFRLDDRHPPARQFELSNLLKRIHILEGFAIVFNALDEAIRDHPRQRRQGRRLAQADGPVHALLRTGRRGPRDQALPAGQARNRRHPGGARRQDAPGPARLEALLDDEPARWKIIRGELKEIGRAYGDARRTRFSEAKAPQIEYREEDYIIDEDAWVIVSRDGWIKRQKSFTDVASIRVRDDDRVGWIYRARARQTLTFFTDRGIAYTLRVNDIPLTTGHGEPFQQGLRPRRRRAPRRRRLPRPPLPPRVRARRSGPRPCSPCSAASSARLNGDGQRPNGVAPGPYAVTLTAGGKVLRFPLATHAPVSNRKGRLVDPPRPDDP